MGGAQTQTDQLFALRGSGMRLQVLRSEDFQTSLECMILFLKIHQASLPPGFGAAALAPGEPKSLRTIGLLGILKARFNA